MAISAEQRLTSELQQVATLRDNCVAQVEANGGVRPNSTMVLLTVGPNSEDLLSPTVSELIAQADLLQHRLEFVIVFNGCPVDQHLEKLQALNHDITITNIHAGSTDRENKATIDVANLNVDNNLSQHRIFAIAHQAGPYSQGKIRALKVATDAVGLLLEKGYRPPENLFMIDAESKFLDEDGFSNIIKDLGENTINVARVRYTNFIKGIPNEDRISFEHYLANSSRFVQSACAGPGYIASFVTLFPIITQAAIHPGLLAEDLFINHLAIADGKSIKVVNGVEITNRTPMIKIALLKASGWYLQLIRWGKTGLEVEAYLGKPASENHDSVVELTKIDRAKEAIRYVFASRSIRTTLLKIAVLALTELPYLLECRNRQFTDTPFGSIDPYELDNIYRNANY